ncbi:hypothetical protein [Ureibacillus acetophenoni]|uniref:Uncharacterized protein n=1 Tax=Ureibacillus acetophenoni TaxID=614649 RepID=A0A285UL07_9BACL|nr:hypothetical protein [Ureibacillus acetophenoni]SOC42539.1 hypothetical protein SAMN05877842_11329 [Ureibacillus acetophenoni]
MRKTRVVPFLFALLLIFALPFQQVNAADSKDDSKNTVTELLKEVYTNEQNLNSYKFEGSLNLGLELSETDEIDPEIGMILELLKDIQVDISGAYKKDPMQIEATIDLTLKGDLQTTFSMPIVMTEEKMWIKYPDTPFLPLPEEVKGKFIEFNLVELAEISGQPATIDYDLQQKLTTEIYNLFFDVLGKDFYKEVDSSSVTIPEGVEVDKVIKFEITNETLKPFIKKVVNELLPKYVELFKNPEYIKALGLTVEDIKTLKELKDSFTEEGISINELVDELLTKLDKYLTINQLDEIIVITEDNYISYDEGTIDFTVSVEDEGSFNVKLSFVQSKSNVNEEFDFSIGIPSSEDVLPFEVLMEIEEEALLNLENQQ